MNRGWIACAAVLLAAGAASAAEAAPAPPALDSRLAEARLSSAPVAVWVVFRDKGRDAADLSAALARAEASLAPRARARRLRARVSPLVDARDLPVGSEYLEALRRRGLETIAVSRWLNRAAVRAPGHRLDELASLPFVERVQPVERSFRSRPEPGESPTPPSRVRGAIPRIESVTGCAGVAAPEPGRTYDALSQVGLLSLHACGYSGAGVLVCVLDDGFKGAATHEALRDRVIAPGHTRDFAEGDTLVDGPAASGHGTATYGILAGNRPGVYLGAAFGADYALARTEVTGSEQQVEMLYWVMAAEWADSLGADVISSSLGYYTFDDPSPDYTYADMNGRTTDVSRATQIAAAKGILVVNAVGNEGNGTWHYLIAPADVHGDSMIAVGAVNAFGEPAGFSSFGPSADGRIKPDLVALGVDAALVSAESPAGYGAGSGTSYSAPLVAGLVACLLEAHPEWSPVELIRALRETASMAGAPDNKRGHGIPDGRGAVSWSPVTGPAPSGVALAVRLAGPNPMLGAGVRTTVQYALTGRAPDPVEAKLVVVDALGREVRRLWSGTLCGGETLSAEWDGRDEEGRESPSGVYWVALRGGGEIASVRLVRLS